ncbi:histone acetyltransferase subunit NuA4-domain-containing protein [Glomus cerebriforme]|uniref:Chromatin modification-related protein EAF6 n=1 Tax=Glomus cerebriforme TaxID=658196 RepID=A0A397T9W3_9GLOM|nr:histone acetyltransferase subunit NuA4-domain-containing protein [Glomus cerebriforme]
MPDVGEDISANNNAPPVVTRQKLEEVEAELKELLVRKKQVDKSLKTIENNIWNFEGSYLEETHSGGNLIRGFDSYLRPSTEKKKRIEITPEERLFSRSSVTSEKAVSINDESSSSSDDYIKNGYKQMSSNRKKKKQRHSFTFTQEVKQEVKRIKFTYQREGKDTEEELDIN